MKMENKTLIWKEELKLLRGDISILLPRGAQFIHAHFLNGVPCVWFMFNEKNKEEKEQREFIIVYTGETFDGGACSFRTYPIHTFITGEGLVLHLLEKIHYSKNINAVKAAKAEREAAAAASERAAGEAFSAEAAKNRELESAESFNRAAETPAEQIAEERRAELHLNEDRNLNENFGASL